MFLSPTKRRNNIIMSSSRFYKGRYFQLYLAGCIATKKSSLRSAWRMYNMGNTLQQEICENRNNLEWESVNWGKLRIWKWIGVVSNVFWRSSVLIILRVGLMSVSFSVLRINDFPAFLFREHVWNLPTFTFVDVWSCSIICLFYKLMILYDFVFLESNWTTFVTNQTKQTVYYCMTNICLLIFPLNISSYN